MIATISIVDFDFFREAYRKHRLGIFNHQPSGVKANECDLDLFSNFFHDRKIKQISGEGILAFLTYLKEERGNQPAAINRKESSIRTYLKYLRFNQVNGAEAFPIESLPRVKEPYSGPVKALEPEEVQKILSSIDKESVLGFRDFLVYSLLYRLGLRVGEAVSINFEDIDFEKETLTIHGKGRKERKLPLLPDLVEHINTWLIYRTKLQNSKKLNALFISKKGNRLAVRTVQDNLAKLVEKCGSFSIEKITPHSFRHAFATHAIEGEQDFFVLKALMGHSSSKSTEIYLHPSMRVLKKAVNNHIASEIIADLINKDMVVSRVQQVGR